MNSPDPRFLFRCLQLAQLGGTKVCPNPKVGSVIVHQGRIIGEGFHPYSGGPHAEVVAVEAVKDKSLLTQSTIYVSLEPCNHFGKTPPCVDLILKHKIPRVVVGCLDPNPKVAGKGIERLRSGGVEVILAENPIPFQELNEVFFLNQQKKRPFIVLKWAETADRFTASRKEEMSFPIKITSRPANEFVHQLRARYQSIMVGCNTAAIDNPSLNTRLFWGDNPIRIVMDQSGKLDQNLNIFSDGGKSMILSVESVSNVNSNVHYFNPGEWIDWEIILKKLYGEYNICSILIEGGVNLHQQFLAQGLFDKIIILRSPDYIGKGLKAPDLPELPFTIQSLGRDWVLEWGANSFS